MLRISDALLATRPGEVGHNPIGSNATAVTPILEDLEKHDKPLNCKEYELTQRRSTKGSHAVGLEIRLSIASSPPT